MSHALSALDEKLLRLDRVDRLSVSDFLGIARRLERALTSPSSSLLRKLSELLREAVGKALRGAEGDVRETVMGRSERLAILQAYRLGQLAFAQAAVAQALESRGDERFTEALADPVYAKYIEALQGAELTNSQLRERSAERSETVSRKLAELRALGIADFRKRGTNTINMLTPAARAALQSRDRGPVPMRSSQPPATIHHEPSPAGADQVLIEPLEMSLSGAQNPEVQQKILETMSNLEDYLKGVPVLSGVPASEALEPAAMEA